MDYFEGNISVFFFHIKTSDVRSSTKKPVRCVVSFQNLWLSQTWQKRNDLLWFLHTFIIPFISSWFDSRHVTNGFRKSPWRVFFVRMLGPNDWNMTWRLDWKATRKHGTALMICAGPWGLGIGPMLQWLFYVIHCIEDSRIPKEVIITNCLVYLHLWTKMDPCQLSKEDSAERVYGSVILDFNMLPHGFLL